MEKPKRFLITLGIIILCIFCFYGCFKNTYNGFVEKDENVSQKWSEVQNQYQRRYDLIPNLTATVKGYAQHEKEVFEEVAKARASAGGQINVSDSILNDPEAFANYQQIQDQLGASLQRLLVVTENYPELKADKNFLALQDELASTENKIAVERKRFTESVEDYNKSIRMFPKNIIANMCGFTKKEYFNAAVQAQEAPKVEF